MPAQHDWIDYGEFGERFVRRAVTTERVHDALQSIAGKSLTIGPIGAGPLSFIRLSATAAIGDPVVHARSGELVTFDATIPLSMSLHVKVGHEVASHCDVSIDLVLAARTASPLLIVIDVPAVTADDVRIDLRASGLAAAALPFVEVLERDIRAQIARFVTDIVNERSRRDARVIDIAARIDDRPETVPDQLERISYASFGAAFFRHAVTTERLSSNMDSIAGRTFDIGPLQAGPKDRATVTGHGVVGDPKVRPVSPADLADDLVTFDVSLPITLDLRIEFRGTFDYRCDIWATVRLVARAADPLLVVVVIPPVTPSDVDVQMTASGLLGRLLESVGGLKAQIRDQVAARINAETADDSDRVVNVAASVDSA